MTTTPDEFWNNTPPTPVPSQEQAPVPTGKPQKKKGRWGMAEVLASVFLLIVFQLVISIGFIVYIVAEYTAQNPNALSDATGLTNYLLDEVTSSGPLIFFSSVAMYVAWVGTMWYSTRFRGKKSWRKDFWLQFHKNDWWKGLLLAVGLFGGLNGIMFLIDAAGVDTAGSDNASIFLNMDGLWFILIACFMVPILGPICEELFFRGFLLQGLIRWFRHGNNQGPKTVFGGWWLNNFAFAYNVFSSFRHFVYRQKYTLAIILSSAVFGLMHFQGAESFGQWMVVVITGLLGAVFAVITVRTRRLGIAIFGHVFYNSITMAVAITQMTLGG